MLYGALHSANDLVLRQNLRTGIQRYRRLSQCPYCTWLHAQHEMERITLGSSFVRGGRGVVGR